MNGRMMHRSLVLALVLGACCALAQAQFSGIYTFNGNAEGDNPGSPGLLAQGTDGYLYGTVPGGWLGSTGSWFQYAMTGYPTMIDFEPSLYGANAGVYRAYSGFTLGLDGNLYGGATSSRGSMYGALFRLSGGTLTNIYSFTGTGGSFPHAPPIQGVDGNLYGVTSDGGSSGVVYQVLMNATTGQGSQGWCRTLPSGSTAPLVVGTDGNFYGTYSNGSFSTVNGVAVANPGGFGGIFEITPAGVIAWYYNLNPFSASYTGGDGQNPYGPVMEAADGYLYGTAANGGAFTSTLGNGVVFKIGLNGTGYTQIHSFKAAEGTAPTGGLVQGSDAYLYGLVSKGGTLSPPYSGHGFPAYGALFKLRPDGTSFATLFTFFRASALDGHGPGSDPESTPVLHTNGQIYGLTNTGGFVSNGATRSTQGGYFDDGGEFFTYSAGLSPFVSVVGRRSARTGDRIGIIGQGFLNATGVTFGGAAAAWTKFSVSIWSDTYMTVTVPTSAKTGPVVVQETTGNVSTVNPLTIYCGSLLCMPRHIF